MNLMEIRAKARRLKQRHDLKLIVVDYLQLMTSPKRTESRQQEVADLSRGLKLLAKEVECPVIAVSQLNRGPEQRTDKRPQLSDLRESGSIEQDADVVILLHRDDYYDKESPRAGRGRLHRGQAPKRPHRHDHRRRAAAPVPLRRHGHLTDGPSRTAERGNQPAASPSSSRSRSGQRTRPLAFSRKSWSSHAAGRTVSSLSRPSMVATATRTASGPGGGASGSSSDRSRWWTAASVTGWRGNPVRAARVPAWSRTASGSAGRAAPDGGRRGVPPRARRSPLGRSNGTRRPADQPGHAGSASARRVRGSHDQ